MDKIVISLKAILKYMDFNAKVFAFRFPPPLAPCFTVDGNT